MVLGAKLDATTAGISCSIHFLLTQQSSTATFSVTSAAAKAIKAAEPQHQAKCKINQGKGGGGAGRRQLRPWRAGCPAHASALRAPCAACTRLATVTGMPVPMLLHSEAERR